MRGLSPELVDSEVFGHRRGAFTGAHIDRTGLLAEADGGTLFLDEITELPLHIQAKLLHVLDNGHYRRIGDSRDSHADVRIIAATNRNIEHAINDGLLRNDLYHRLCGLHVMLPPLRQRGSADIIRIANHLLQNMCNKKLSPQANTWLAMQQWHGNVRELANTLRHAAVFGEGVNMITPADFPIQSSDDISPNTAGILDDIERHAIERTIAQHHGNLRAAARALGINASTLHRKRKRWGSASTHH